MILSQKEVEALTDLQTQEKSCIQKYEKYSAEACDPVLQDLFNSLQKEEEKHYQSITQALSGSISSSDCNDQDGKNYHPKATYQNLTNSDNKAKDCFLATDCIGTEKLVSSEYNTNVFHCSESDLRKLLADIQIEEQNHAEMLYKYKQVNSMF